MNSVPGSPLRTPRCFYWRGDFTRSHRGKREQLATRAASQFGQSGEGAQRETGEENKTCEEGSSETAGARLYGANCCASQQIMEGIIRRAVRKLWRPCGSYQTATSKPWVRATWRK